MRARLLWLIVAILFIVAVSAGYDPEITQLALVRGRYLSNQLLYDRHLEVFGLRILSKDEILKSLPTDRSNLWWRLNISLISARLTSNPLVQSGSVNPCHWYSISCFNISIQEQHTAAIVIVDREAWAMNTQGAVISRIASADGVKRAVDNLAPDVPHPLIVEGAWKKNTSADKVSARVTVVLKLVHEFERASGHHVRHVELTPEGEGLLILTGLKLELVIDFEHPEMISEYAQRFQRILFELRGKEQQIAKVDLAFNKMAVVKMKEEIN